MRASTIFALIAAVLLGLGAAVGIKYSGVLDRKAETPKVVQPTLVLVAANNLYEGTFLQATDVKIRAVRSDDEKEAVKRGELLSPVIQAAVRRTTRLAIPADTAIRKEHLEELGARETLADRIPPCDRGVHCCLHKQYCAGGIINTNDYVDVHFTTTVEGTDAVAINNNAITGTGTGAGGRTASAVVARGVRVIARRNSLVPVNTPLGPDCCINYTLATNPYRAALIDYVKTMGILALHPVGAMERARYDADDRRKRDEANAMRLKGDTGIRSVVGADRTGDIMPLTLCATGDAREDERINGILNGTYTIGEKDLMELFGLKYVPSEQPRQRHVVKISGVDFVGVHDLTNPQGGLYDGNTQLTSGTGRVGGIRTVAGRSGMIVDQTGQQAPLRFRTPDAACFDRVVAAPVVRRRN